MKRFVVALIMVSAVAALAVPARAADQVVDATVTSTLSMTTSPSASVSWVLASTGANTTSGGTVAVNSNQPYTISVTADKTRLTEYITATSAYVAASPKTVAAALSVIAARTGGTAVVPAVAATAIVGTSTLFATGTGLGTDTFSSTLSQATLITDPALPSGRTYHIVLTYTLSSTL